MKTNPKLSRRIISVALMLALTAFVMMSAQAETAVDYGPAVTLTMGTTGAVDDISTKAAQYFCDIVKERSNGVITIDLFPASQLGAALDQMEMLSGGSIDLFLEANYMANFGIKDIKAASVMFVTRSREDYQRLTESDYFKEQTEAFKDSTGIRVLVSNWFRNCTAIASKGKIETLEDCAGVKLRVPPVTSTIDMFNAFGFNATPVAYNETLISLQQGVIDGVWCTEDAIWTMGFYEPTNFVFELLAFYDSLYVYINDNLYTNMLTDAQRELIYTCASDAGDYYAASAASALDANRANWEAAGVETVTITPEEQARWAEIALQFGYSMEAAGEWSEGTLDRVLAINGY